MNTAKEHLIRTEYVDSRHRHWCAVCRLPHTNALAKAAHSAALARIESDITRDRYEPDAA